MNTQEAFTYLVHSPYLWRKTGASDDSRRLYKHRMLKGEWPSISRMEALISCVYDVKQEKQWKFRD